MSETIYTTESPLQQPGSLFTSMLRDLLASRELAWRLLVRNLHVQFRRSFLGAAWAFIPAAATALVMALASQARIVSVAETALPYPAYVVLSMTLWQAFLEGLNGPVQALAAEMRLLVRFNVAPEPIVLAKLGEALFNCGVRSLLTAALFLWYGMPVGASIVLAPFGVLALILLGASLGLLLAPLSALYEDFTKSLPIVTSFWFFLTPILYPVPEQGAFSFIVQFNPVTPLLVTTRELIVGLPLSSPLGFCVSASCAVLLLLLGWLVNRVAMPIVLERARF
jgi:lipopolysaccharide transport system permease protein